jgi:hypoxanthine phosphoribosyltransferase
MKEIRLGDLTFEESISYEALIKKIEEIAHQINVAFAGKRPVFIVVLKGAFLFAAEIIKRFEGECEIEFVQLSSYQGTQTTSQIQEKLFVQSDLKDRDVIILEDIVDTGHTVNYLFQRFNEMKVRSITTVVLLFKPEAFKYDYPLGYVAFQIPSDFVVGFGLDYNEKGRNIPGIYKLKNI